MGARSIGGNLPDRVGPFTVLRRIGAGGMAEAFEGVRRGAGGFEQRVCVKRVLPAYSTDPEFVRLFLREARLAASLSHRNVTRVLDFGQDQGCHYLALELIEGMDLRRLLRAVGPNGRLPLELALFLALEIAEGLQHAHTRRGSTGPVVHRDVSPANTLLSVDGDVKLTDFGISKALDDAGMTQTEFVRGNIWYMAPEQLDVGRQADPRSDLFSLGVVLYQTIAGKRPYQGPTELATMKALADGERVPLSQSAPGTPGPVVTIVERLLAHEPGDRFQSGAEVAAALTPLVSVRRARRDLGELVRTHRAGTPPRPEPVTASLPTRRVQRARDVPPKRPRWARYSLAPRTWAAADRVAEARERENRPLPIVEPTPDPAITSRPIEQTRESEEPRVGRSSLWWIALAVTAASGLTCAWAGWALAS